MSQTHTSRTHLHYRDSCLRSLNFLSSHCNALLAVASSIVAAIAKRWIGNMEEIVKEAIKWNVQILKYVRVLSSVLVESHVELFRVT